MTTSTWRDDLRQAARESWCFWRHLGHRWQTLGPVATRFFGLTTSKRCARCGTWRAW